MNPDKEDMVHYYPLLVEAVCEFKRAVRNYLAKQHDKVYEEGTNQPQVPLAPGYKLQFNLFNDTYFCLKQD